MVKIKWDKAKSLAQGIVNQWSHLEDLRANSSFWLLNGRMPSCTCVSMEFVQLLSTEEQSIIVNTLCTTVDPQERWASEGWELSWKLRVSSSSIQTWIQLWDFLFCLIHLGINSCLMGFFKLTLTLINSLYKNSEFHYNIFNMYIMDFDHDHPPHYLPPAPSHDFVHQGF
jgi:hypothetical protein